MRRSLALIVGLIAILSSLAPAGPMAPAPVLASHTGAPASVTIAGSLQSELGCPGDWQPECAATHLAFDATDQVWQGTFAVPIAATPYEYKAALNDAWTENYGANATSDGPNISLTVGDANPTKFYYSHGSHWVTSNRNTTIATAAGSFQSEIGCPGDWAPDCLRSWLQDPGRRRRLHLRHRRHPGRRLRLQGRPRRGLDDVLPGERRPVLGRGRRHRHVHLHGGDQRGHRRRRAATSRPTPRTWRSPGTRCATT